MKQIEWQNMEILNYKKHLTIKNNLINQDCYPCHSLVYLYNDIIDLHPTRRTTINVKNNKQEKDNSLCRIELLFKNLILAIS
jgi:hypothetical protein